MQVYTKKLPGEAPEQKDSLNDSWTEGAQFFPAALKKEDDHGLHWTWTPACTPCNRRHSSLAFKVCFHSHHHYCFLDFKKEQKHGDD